MGVRDRWNGLTSASAAVGCGAVRRRYASGAAVRNRVAPSVPVPTAKKVVRVCGVGLGVEVCVGCRAIVRGKVCRRGVDADR